MQVLSAVQVLSVECSPCAELSCIYGSGMAEVVLMKPNDLCSETQFNTFYEGVLESSGKLGNSVI